MWKWWLNNTVKGTQAINNSPYLLKLFSVSVSYQLDLHYSNLFPPLICFENHVNFSFVKLKLLPFVRKFALRSLFFFLKKSLQTTWPFVDLQFQCTVKDAPLSWFSKGIHLIHWYAATNFTHGKELGSFQSWQIRQKSRRDRHVCKDMPQFSNFLVKKVHILHLGVLKSFFFWLLWFICYSHSSAVRTEEALHGLLHTWASASEYQRQTLTAPPAGTQPTKYANRFACTAINGFGCADVARLLIGQRVGAVKFWD